MKRLSVMVVIFIFGLVFLGSSPVFAGDVEDLYERIEQLEEKVEKKESEGTLGKLGENITFSGAIELDYSYMDPRDTTVVNSDSTSNLDIGTVELGAEVKFHEWVTGNLLLKGENLDDDDRVFWDEATITIQKEGFPIYFVGGHRGQPFGVFESHTISDTVTQDCYEVVKSGATVGFTPDFLGLDISATVYKGEVLMSHLEEAGYGFGGAIRTDDTDPAYYDDQTDDVESYIANVTISPLEGLNIGDLACSVYFDSEPGDDERNNTVGGTIRYQYNMFTFDAEYIKACKREKGADGIENKESAWFAAIACQAMDPLEIAVRYEAFDDDMSGDQDGHLEDRYIAGVNYTLFEKENFTTTLMLEYRKSNYEKAAGSAVDDTVDEVFAKVAMAF